MIKNTIEVVETDFGLVQVAEILAWLDEDSNVRGMQAAECIRALIVQVQEQKQYIEKLRRRETLMKELSDINFELGERYV